MTVGDLKIILEDFEEDTLVVLSSDSEGNSISPLADVDGFQYHYEPESSHSGDLIYIHEEEGGVPCVVLWPTR